MTLKTVIRRVVLTVTGPPSAGHRESAVGSVGNSTYSAVTYPCLTAHSTASVRERVPSFP